jgi:hypothetical protein
MDSEDVLILSVENSAECLCLGKRKDKGKHAANSAGKRQPKKLCSGRKARENCLVILDGDSGSEDNYIEVYGEKADLAHVDSAADGKDILECVVNSPKLDALHEDSTVLRGTGEGANRAKPSCPSLAQIIPSIEMPKTAPNLVSASLDCIDHHLPAINDVSKSRPIQPVATAPKDSENSGGTELDQLRIGTNLRSPLHRTPTCWTNCPNCPPSKKSKYHLIDVAYGCPEWGVVSTPLTQAGFTVNRVQRVQNESLWERLCYEKQLMLRDRVDVNEQLLYHTSRSSIPVICEEGLDLRLSRNGMFGSGIYFRYII